MGIAARAQDSDDIRATARTAARIRGLSLGDFFDDALRSKAAALGVAPADLGPDQRIDAVMDRLREVGRSARPATETGKLRTGVMADGDPERETRPATIRDANGAGQPVMQALSQRRDDHHDDQEAPVTQTSASAAAAEQPEPLPSSSALAAAGSRQAAQRVEIESKLNALFKALDRTPRRQSPEAGDDEDIEDRRKRALLGETAISPSWRLDKAVAEIAERQAVLDRQASEGAGQGRPEAADLRRVLAHAPEAGVPSIFTALQTDIARLAGTLEAVQLDVSRWPSAGKGPTLDEMRALLADARPDASLVALGDSIEKLSSRLDVHAAGEGQSAAVERLSRRIEQVHAELAEQVAAYRPGIDTARVEQLVAEVVARSPALPTPDLSALEAAVKALAGKLTAVERSQGDDRLLFDMQVQVTRLAERIDRTDAGLAAIVAMERSLGDILCQVNDMKDIAAAAAESAGRSAAIEAVQALVPPIGDLGGEGKAPAAVMEVSRSLAEMRADREKADERLHAILTALNDSLDRVVDRLEALESEPDPATSPANVMAKQAAAEQPDWQPKPAAAAELRTAFPPAAAPEAPAITWTAPANSISFEPGEPLDLDLPLEPGMRPGSAMPEAAPAVPASIPDPSSFIAAARRAAQNAAQEQAARYAADAASATGAPDAAAGRKRFTIGMLSRRRPLLLALAGLLVLAGAAQIARMSLGDPSASMQDVTGSTPPAPPAIPATPDDRSEALPAEPATKTASAGSSETATADAPATVVSAAAPPPAAEDGPQKALPTMAMGPMASVAALKAADASARLNAMPGIPVGLQELADGGRPDAQFEVGLRYAEGRRVPRDLKAAATWFEKASNGGLAPAAYRLGSLYEKGIGVSRDAAQSMSWYRKAADAGNVRAMHNLAVMLAEGAGTKADYPQAVAWFSKAAEAGVRDSQYNLAILFARGLGTPQDLGKAFVWFSTAAAQGDVDSAKKRDEVASRMDAAALEAAKTAAGAFKPVSALTAANEVKPPPGGWDAVPPRAAAANAHLSKL